MAGLWDCLLLEASNIILPTEIKENKMKRIQRSKEPTVRQMLNMTVNLKEKYNKYASLSIWTRSYDNIPDTATDYNLYIADTDSWDFKTWEAYQDKYFELMKLEPKAEDQTND